MELEERIRQTWEAIADHPKRVVASSLGVFWGAAALVLMLAWSTGFRDFMKSTFTNYGRGGVMIGAGVTSSGYPGQRAGVPVRIDRRDVSAIERENGELVTAILAEHISEERILVEHRGKVRRLDLTATDPRFPAYRNFRLRAGRFFSHKEAERAQAVAVLGGEAARDFFPDPHSAIGRTLRLDGQPFELIGVLDEKSGMQTVNTNRPDNRVLVVPAQAAEERLGYDRERVDRLIVYPRPAVSGEVAFHAVARSLAARANFHPDDTDALRHFDLTDTLRSLDWMHIGFNVFIGLAGTLTLLVGAVGIANDQLARISEREFELGVALAIGARMRTLVGQAVLEAVLVSGLAAGLGSLFGVAGCAVLSRLAPPDLFPVPVISPQAVLATAFALLLVTALAAVLPALRVRRVDVSAALRETS